MTQPFSPTASDIPEVSWIDRLAPSALRPYLRLARLDRPAGWWLLLLPCWWGLALASSGWPDPWFALLFLIGAVVMRGAGCTLNDVIDRDFDARVARTAGRPIPSGAVSVRQALTFTVLLCLTGFTVLIQFNLFTIFLGAGSLALVAVYPFMKRITHWPQAWLGLTFNYGALVGWAAGTGGLAAPAILLYAAGIAWTLGYDTIYAHQDKEDDALIGVRSTALRLGPASRRWLGGFYAATVLLLAGAGALAGIGWAFWAGLAAVAAHFAWQVVRVDLDDPKSCLAVFRSNRDAGLIIAAAIIAGQLAV